MADTRGTWSLSEAWGEKSAAEWVNVDDVYLDTNEGSHGFWLGGTNKSNFDKLVYATDTLSTPTSNLGTPSTPSLAVANNDTHAFISGDAISPNNHTYKHTLSADTLSVSPGLEGLYPSSSAAVAAGTKTTGWYFSSSGWDMNKVDFSSETRRYMPSVPTLPQGISGASSVASNQETAAISPASTSGNSGSRVIRFTFANDTTMSYGWTLVSNNNEQGALDAGADGNSGFMIGGLHGSRVEKVDFISDVATVLPGSNMAGHRNTSGCNSQGTTTGYIAGGSSFSPSPPSYKGEKMPYSTMTMAQMPGVPATLSRSFVRSYSGSSHNLPSLNLSYKRWSTDAAGRGPGCGYKTMGWTASSNSVPSGRNNTEKISLIVDYANVIPGGTSPVKMSQGASFSNITDGISATGRGGHGSNPDANMYSYVIKFNYATETSSSLDSYSHYSPGSGIGEAAGFGGPTAGYLAGGSYVPGAQNQNVMSSVSKFDFSSNTWSASTPSVAPKAGDSNLQNSTFAMRAGGWYSGDIPFPEKMPWSTETWTTIPAYPGPSFSDNKSSKNDPGNEQFGYIGGNSSPGNSRIVRVDYHTDTTTTCAWLSPASPSANKWTGTSGLGNKTLGAFVSGGIPPAGLNPDICRWDYATETLSSWGSSDDCNYPTYGHYTFSSNKVGQGILRPDKSTKTDANKSLVLNPALTRYSHSYFSTGNPWPSNNPDKLNFSNDTVSSAPGQNIRLYEGVAFSSPTHWYYTLGSKSPGWPQGNTSTYKIQYSNDTATNAVSSVPNLGTSFHTIRYHTAFSDHSGGKGYVTGGYTSPAGTPWASSSSTFKITYATDVWNECPWAYVTDSFGWYSAFGRSNGRYGYHIGGKNGSLSPTSTYVNTDGSKTTTKLDFSNETWIPVTTATMPVGSPLYNGGNMAGITWGTTDAAYLGGGWGDSGSTSVLKLSYSSETLTILPGKLLSTVDTLRSSSSDTHGYRGGQNNSNKSNISKYEFSTGTEVASPSNFSADSQSNRGSSVQDDVGGYSESPNVI